MTKAAQEFVTPLSVGAIAGERAFTDLFDPASEFDVGHIRLARDTDLVVVAPATADLMAKMANGHADDLATAVLLATDKQDAARAGDEPGDVGAHGDAAQSRAARRRRHLDSSARTPARWRRAARPASAAWPSRWRSSRRSRSSCDREPRRRARQPLAGKRIVITSGPTHEPIDPVRYIANRSSGKQGHAIARAAAAAGADVTLVSGPGDAARSARREDRAGRDRARDAATPSKRRCRPMSPSSPRRSPTGASAGDGRAENQEGRRAARRSSRWSRIPTSSRRFRKLKTKRPRLVIGFAAETEKVIEHATAKLKRKGCDWIVANDVSPETGVMGGDDNTVHLITRQGRRVLADAVEGRRRRDAGRAHRRRAERQGHMSALDRPHPAAAARRGPAAAGLSERRAPPASICSPPCRPTRR